MRYYSDLTKKAYDTVDELQKAENELSAEQKEKEVARKKRADAAKEVENAFKKASDAEKNAEALLRDFVKTYGSYHRTYYETDLTSDPFLNLFDNFFNMF
jgi:seryl-tRNA synthetase